MTAPEVSDTVLGWLFVIGICIAAVGRGAWAYLKKMSTVEVTPGNSNSSNGKAVTFDARLIQEIRDDVRAMAKIAVEDWERRKQEYHDRQLMDRWERMQARKRRRGEDDDDDSDNGEDPPRLGPPRRR